MKFCFILEIECSSVRVKRISVAGLRHVSVFRDYETSVIVNAVSYPFLK